MDASNTKKVRLIYGLLVASFVVAVPLKAVTHPCTFGGESAATSDLLKSAGGSFMLVIWLATLALSLVVISGKEGKYKMQLFWILVVIGLLAFFAYAMYQDVTSAVADGPRC